MNNASAITLLGTEELEVKRYDLMQTINARGTFVETQACFRTSNERPTRTS